MSNMGFSEREILDGKEFMKMREFWMVYDGIDNCDLLQAILNKYHNDTPNTYTAEILDHQNSSRIVVKCNVCCGTQLSSYDPFISHNNGKNHKKNLVERQDFANTMSDVPVLSFKRIDEIENPHERNTLECDLFETTYDIIGYQFLYRELKNSGEFITCQLCERHSDKNKHMKRSSALRHMQSTFHQNNYLRAKFDIKNSTLINEQSRQSFISDVIKREGKLLHKILTIDKTDPNEVATSSERKYDVGVEEASSLTDQIKDPKVPETAEEFLQVTQDHLQYLSKNKGGDVVIKNLQKDPEAMDLLISAMNVLSQKIYLFADTYDSDFKEQARKLLDRSGKFKLPNLEEF